MSSTIERSNLRYTGDLRALSEDQWTSLMRRTNTADPGLRPRTEAIIRRVRAAGDRALREMAGEYDGVTLGAIEVPGAVRRKALSGLDPELRSALERAARNIECFHRASRPETIEVETEPGVTVGKRPDPLQRVGIYAPGGRASYASSVLMTGIPARAARVPEIVLCSPPRADGYPAPAVLAACEIAGVDSVFSVGGAGAIAAMAYGTETVPSVDRIVGPGNAYVAEAKLQVSRDVGIDSPAGPTELLVICDATSDVNVVAREVFAQAEHDADAWSVVLCPGEVEPALAAAIEERLRSGSASGVARAALAQNGALLRVDSVDEALAFAAEWAPEHLLLAVNDAQHLLPAVRNAGCVFVGEQSSVVFGDYITGGNHVLPTGSQARRYSALSPLDFVRWTSYQRLTRDAARRLSADTAILARAEGLPGHAAAALGWGRAC